MEVSGKHIFVGLSGGVDSAVSAALLKQTGTKVIGVFIKGWYPPGMPCTWALDRRDAMRVAARLQIPFHTLDASAEYKKSVIDYLLAEYAAGRTPNPDVMCNRDIKFGAFYRYALEQGADTIATGHYRSGEKDQSYFLWAVSKDILEKALFPVGQMDKKDVRALAKQFNLPVAEKKDSQGVCFLGSISIKDFLRQELGTESDAILHTIGERVEGKYVVAKDARGLTLADERARSSLPIVFEHPNWFAELPDGEVQAQYRYRGPRVSGRIKNDRFEPKESVTEPAAPGQSIVFYRGGQLLGGGIIAG